MFSACARYIWALRQCVAKVKFCVGNLRSSGDQLAMISHQSPGDVVIMHYSGLCKVDTPVAADLCFLVRGD